MKRMMKLIPLLLLVLILLSACNTTPTLKRYSYTFTGAFDTAFQIIAYTESEAKFNEMASYLETRVQELHRLYDKYNAYDGIINLKTVNEQAATAPMTVVQPLFDLLSFAKEMNAQTSGKTNIAFGAVLKIWSQYRDEGIDDPDSASLPPLEILEKAVEHTSIDDLILNAEKFTVYFEDSQLSLDVGAVAKGYATELVAQELIEKGYNSFIISSGGNIRTVGQPSEKDRSKWGVGLQDPDRYIFEDDRTLDTVYVNDMSVVSSGDYQRYYYVGDERIHHLIDPSTLFPANYYRAVNILFVDSGKADFYSTEIFLLPYEEGRAFVEATLGLEAQWIFPDGHIEMTDGFTKVAKSQGALPK
jgi:thiamine biosynthesis lipoprotein